MLLQLFCYLTQVESKSNKQWKNLTTMHEAKSKNAKEKPHIKVEQQQSREFFKQNLSQCKKFSLKHLSL